MVKMAKRKKIGIIFDSALGTHVGTYHIVLKGMYVSKMYIPIMTAKSEIMERQPLLKKLPNLNFLR